MMRGPWRFGVCGGSTSLAGCPLLPTLVLSMVAALDIIANKFLGLPAVNSKVV